jgi:hypothetical protein
MKPTACPAPRAPKARFRFGPGGKWAENRPIAVGVLQADPRPSIAINTMKAVSLGANAVAMLLRDRPSGENHK